MSQKNTLYNIELSAVIVIIGICVMFIMAIAITLAAPTYMDESWISPSSPYQRQMYEDSDYNVYISTNLNDTKPEPIQVYHLKQGETLLAFQETDSIKIVAPESLEQYITRDGEKPLKLTTNLLLLREPETNEAFDAKAEAEKLIKSLSDSTAEDEQLDDFDLFDEEHVILELYQYDGDEAFSLRTSNQIVENWVEDDYTILDKDTEKQSGVIYVGNPTAFENATTLQELKDLGWGFYSRHELIRMGEDIYAHEGCWYCHTDQTRTLIQDVVLTGTNNYPAPPSSANEYIYEEISFTGTRRIGPDISRVGIHRTSRDWHKLHFWLPESMTPGSIMPYFRHFFTKDLSNPDKIGHPNHLFEAVYQYLMTKGTRITSPNEAWWKGEDPVQTKEIIEGKKQLP